MESHSIHYPDPRSTIPIYRLPCRSPWPLPRPPTHNVATQPPQKGCHNAQWPFSQTQIKNIHESDTTDGTLSRIIRTTPSRLPNTLKPVHAILIEAI